MGIISVERADHLYWIGRYMERVFTTLCTFFDFYDQMIDVDSDAYKRYCEKVAIPDVYGSREVFNQKYLYDKNDPNSVYSNLERAYGNAIVMRDEISSHTLAYVQLALDCLENAADSKAPHYDLQQVIDYIHAFWGCVDDRVEDEEGRNIMKCGKYLERLDLYLRLGYPSRLVEKECSKFLNRLHKVQLNYNKDCEEKLTEIISQGEAGRARYEEALEAIWKFFEVS